MSIPWRFSVRSHRGRRRRLRFLVLDGWLRRSFCIHAIEGIGTLQRGTRLIPRAPVTGGHRAHLSSVYLGPFDILSIQVLVLMCLELLATTAKSPRSHGRMAFAVSLDWASVQQTSFPHLTINDLSL